ncbi:hypothetical protein ACFOZ7_07000 [Natribaculum luteum]|uniref:Uncharacterized protein n=1 Tax=Natribaculum luteum TaxID=1586232 RepID=A0ABD5NXJ2_9EURY|nr:hypothetical protein [Natribaculum luteum]
MTRFARDRAISTVVDVALFLLLVSAAVTTLALFLEDGDRAPTHAEADRTAETLASTTTSVEYSLRPVARTDDTGTFDDTDFDDEAYARVAHGPTAALLADAAVTNVRFDDRRLTAAGEEFEDAVDRTAMGVLQGATDDVHVVAVWTPHDGSSIEGRATAGRKPPSDADVSTATMTVASGVPPVDDDRITAAYERGGFEAAARPIATAIVDGYLPPSESRLALERQSVDRALVVYRYQRLADILGVDLDPEDGVVSRPNANVTAANEKLTDELAVLIAADLEAELASDVEDIQRRYPVDEHDGEIGEAIAETVSTGDVTITVRTWGREP